MDDSDDSSNNTDKQNLTQSTREYDATLNNNNEITNTRLRERSHKKMSSRKKKELKNDI